MDHRLALRPRGDPGHRGPSADPLQPAQHRELGGRLTGEGLLTAAKIVSWINIALTALFAIGFIVFVVIAGIAEKEDEFGLVVEVASSVAS